jgi:hypothetical protein
MLAPCVLAACLAGCMMAGADKGVGPDECLSYPGDCPSGQVCDLRTHECVDRYEASLLFEVNPFNHDQGGGYLPRQYDYQGREPQEVHNPSFGLVNLEPMVAVRGTVYRSPSSSEGGVAATIDFKPVDVLFPDDLRSTVSSSTEEAEDVSSGRFETRLLPGSYEVSVVPASPDSEVLPPLYLDTIEVETPSTPALEVSYPADLRVLAGRLLLASGDPVPHELRVWAVDASSGRRMSTADVTDSGSFSLTLSPTAGNLRLRIAPEESAMAAGYPSLAFGPWSYGELDLDEDGYVNLEADLDIALTLPLLGDLVTYKARVEGTTSAGVSMPLSDVSVSFTARRYPDAGDPWSDALYVVHAVTNAAGEICLENSGGDLVWAVMLRENDYEVTITPPVGGEFESLVVPEVHIVYPEPDGVLMGQVFEVGVKPPLVGRVLSLVTGDAFEGLTAEAHPVRPLASTGEYPLPRFGSDETGYDGQLRMPLDRGVYDLLVKGSASQGVPWIWYEDVSPGNEDSRIEVLVPEPVSFSGTVVDAVGAPASGALVRVYEVGTSLPGEPPVLRILWETTTGGSGGFQVLLDPR